MGLHKPFDRTFVVAAGATMSEGRSLNLVKGQFGIFDTRSTNKEGSKAVASFNGLPKNENRFELKLGTTNLSVNRSQSNKSYSSFPFSLNNVLDLKVSAPKSTEQSVDEVIIGYNGIDANTSLVFEKGQNYKMVVELSGEPIGFLGYENSVVTIPVYLDSESCSALDECINCDPCEAVDCREVVSRAIEILRNHKLRGNVPVTEFIEIAPVYECDNEAAVTLVPYDFYCLDICDTGDEAALAAVQAQYPGINIYRTERNGAISSYQFVQDQTEAAPADLETKLPSIIKGCEDCPDGYTEAEGGIVYAVTLEDDGVDQATVVEGLANAVAGTGLKSDGQVNGVGYYTVVLTAELADADFDTFIDANPTATITKVGEVDSVCNNDTITTTPWAVCDTCNASTNQYTITLPDNECGEDRLAELQAAYPDYDVQINTDPDTGDVIEGGCQTQYIATVPTNLVCDECDPIFNEDFRSEAPETYETVNWELVVVEDTATDCKCGIRIKGKDLEVHPSECLRDTIGFIDSSVKVRMSGGFVQEVLEGIGSTDDNSWDTTYLSRMERRTHMGGNFYVDEDIARVFFKGEGRHFGDNVAKLFKGEESSLDPSKQYVDYALTLRRDTYAQSFSGRLEHNTTFHILVEVGLHTEVEAVLNSLATSAGIAPVQAFGV